MADRRSVLRWIMLAVAAIGMVIVTAAVAIVAVLYYQGTRAPTGQAAYVALGSSYAAGSGLGGRVVGAPFACARGEDSYPRLLAQSLRLSLRDMSCSGATAAQVLNGGQYFQGSQIAAVTNSARLVTLTVGGNDLHYVGDLLGLAKAKDGGLIGWATPRILRAPHGDSARNAVALRDDIRAIVRKVRIKAPYARIVIASYPAILPPLGTCPALGLTAGEADRMRAVAAMLAEATRVAVHESGAILVDMAKLGRAHSVCAAVPWVNGAVSRPGNGIAFHPTKRGAKAIARELAARIAHP